MSRIAIVVTAWLTFAAALSASSAAVQVRTVIVTPKIIVAGAPARHVRSVRRAQRSRSHAAARRHHVPRPLSPAEFGRHAMP